MMALFNEDAKEQEKEDRLKYLRRRSKKLNPKPNKKKADKNLLAAGDNDNSGMLQKIIRIIL